MFSDVVEAPVKYPSIRLVALTGVALEGYNCRNFLKKYREFLRCIFVGLHQDSAWRAVLVGH